ncbi:MAG TPA: histidinol-phosphatase [Planctomycetota bacterium]|nr:histidinol-phosphatase [Planctomycetota bacterium]
MTERLLYETHMHTPLCRHAEGEPEEYADVAHERGLAGIIVTCHNPMPDGWSASLRMREDEFETYLACVERARAAKAGRVEVRLGLECDYFPGYERFVAEQTESAPFDYILGSVHPHIHAYFTRFFTGDPVDFQRTYFLHLADAAETGIFDTISHPDLVKNSFPDDWIVERVLDPVRRSLDRIARAGTAMELNTSGLEKSVPEFNPGPLILREIAERGIPVVIGADAHVPRRVGDNFVRALDVLAEAGFEKVSFFLERKRREVPIAAARASLERNGTSTV